MPDNINLGPASADPLLGSLAILDSVEAGEGLPSFPNLVLGTGSGRCGTRSLAQQLRLKHEPGHHMVGAFIFRWLYGEKRKDTYHKHLVKYKGLCDESIADKGGLVDARLSYIMPLAMEWWPDARWIIVFRHPFDTCRSWIERGYYKDGHMTDNNRFFRPRWNWWDDLPRADKLGWKWNEHYRQILDHDNGTFEYWYADNDLDSVENAGQRTYELTEDDKDGIEEYTYKTWLDLMEKWDRRVDA